MPCHAAARRVERRRRTVDGRTQSSSERLTIDELTKASGGALNDTRVCDMYGRGRGRGRGMYVLRASAQAYTNIRVFGYYVYLLAIGYWLLAITYTTRV